MTSVTPKALREMWQWLEPTAKEVSYGKHYSVSHEYVGKPYKVKTFFYGYITTISQERIIQPGQIVLFLDIKVRSTSDLFIITMLFDTVVCKRIFTKADLEKHLMEVKHE